MEAFSMGESTEIPIVNGENPFPGGIHGRIKGLKQWPGGIVRSPSGSSISSSTKGKGKTSATKKGKSARTGGESDASLEGDDEDMADGAAEDDDDYVVRTDHLSNPMEEVE